MYKYKINEFRECRPSSLAESHGIYIRQIAKSIIMISTAATLGHMSYVNGDTAAVLWPQAGWSDLIATRLENLGEEWDLVGLRIHVRRNSCAQDTIFKIRADIILQNEIQWNCGILAFKVQYTEGVCHAIVEAFSVTPLFESKCSLITLFSGILNLKHQCHLDHMDPLNKVSEAQISSAVCCRDIMWIPIAIRQGLQLLPHAPVNPYIYVCSCYSCHYTCSVPQTLLQIMVLIQ